MTFAARPRAHAVKLNKKMFRAALAMIVSELQRQGRLLIIEKIEIEAPKTKLLVEHLAPYQERRLLLLMGEEVRDISLAARNIPWVHVSLASHVDPVTLVNADKVLATLDGIRQLEGRLL